MLAFDSARTVPAPIRYGRISQSRDNAFTMVLSLAAPLGAAKLVPISSRASTFDDVVAFATAVASAERLPSSLSANWGCIGLLSEDDTLRSQWQEVTRGRMTSVAASFKSELPPIDDAGLLSPSVCTLGDEFDVILAAVTCPTATPPSAANIVGAMGDPPKGNLGHVYFRENRLHGITTFQDAQILEALRARGF